MPQQAVRFPDDLHSAIKAEADRRGKPHTFSSVLIEWATMGGAVQATRPNQRALEAVLSEAKGAPGCEQAGPAPVPSTSRPGSHGLPDTGDGVRPAAQPRTHGKPKPDLMQALKASLDATRPDSALRPNGHLPTCKCWRCEKLDGAA